MTTKAHHIFKRIFLVTIFFLSICIYAQDNDAKVKNIGDKACECLTKINVNAGEDKIKEETNNCIRSVSSTPQLPIEVQRYMAKNCPALKTMAVKAYGENLSTNKEALKYYIEGRNFGNKDKYDLAIASYNKAVIIDPKFVEAYNYLGSSYEELGKYTEAINSYKKSLALKPNEKKPLQNMAHSYEFLNNYKEAITIYEKFIALYPKDPEGYYNAGRTNCMIENYVKGLDYLMKSYKKYKQANSPYLADAKKALDGSYKILQQKGKLEIYTRAAKNNNFEF
ncbi:tetratricopeptide repeat protein [Flavobacterium rivuli]|uniref:tetratricopeptide repeat protein n=1 Tax=Flavobacterium rivuli TaxID=498301 RepID=UPI000374F218|nr:tetratricopeptide repeat protein [Flavobacterium rivuli]